jgi:hypothetical protein
MTKVIRFLAQCIDQNTGDVLEGKHLKYLD